MCYPEAKLGSERREKTGEKRVPHPIPLQWRPVRPPSEVRPYAGRMVEQVREPGWLKQDEALGLRITMGLRLGPL